MKVFHFNPSCEMEVANRLPYFRPPKLVQHLLLDGQALPIYFAEPNDMVVVQQLPSQKFLQGIQHFGFTGREFLTVSRTQGVSASHITPCPWGWSPSAVANFKTWFPAPCGNLTWRPENETWFRRESAANVLQSLLTYQSHWEEALLPVPCTAVEEVEQLLYQWGGVVMKAPLSSSGRGVQFLRKTPLNGSNKQWIQGVIDQQRGVNVERLRNRIFDFSLHFFRHKTGQVEFVGESAFLTNTNGKYQANYIGAINKSPGFPHAFNGSEVLDAKQLLMDVLQSSPIYTAYEGFLGVDLMIYKEEDELKLHPCVEINARHSMGVLAVFLQKWIANSATAFFTVKGRNEVNEQDFFIHKTGGKIDSAYWPLNDYWNSQKFVFMLTVE